MQKLARAVIGTNNMDNCSRYCQAPATGGCFARSATAAIRDRSRTSSRRDRHHHRKQYGGKSSGSGHAHQAGPQIARPKVDRLRPARKRDGSARGCLSAFQRPGTDLFWLSAVTRYILDNGLAKQAFIDKWVNGAGRHTSRASSPSRWRWQLSGVGLTVEMLKKVAHMIAGGR